MSKWHVIQSPTDSEMFAVKSHYEYGELHPEYIVADSLPLEDATLIAAAPDLLEIVRRLAKWAESDLMGDFDQIASDAVVLWAEMQREAGE